MQNITIIIGLPGSWKTTYINNNSEEFKNAVICDDYHKSSYNRSRKFEDSVYYQDLKEALKNWKDAVMCDIAWCKIERREILKQNIQNILEEVGIDAEITFICFKNDPESCKKNVLKRNREGRVEREMEFIDEVSVHYVIPENAVIIPVGF